MMPSSFTVLIIDDFAPDRELCRRYLLSQTDCPYTVLEAESATRGLEICRQQGIAVILLDYYLPDAEGLEFLRDLQQQSNGNPPPVVMITGQENTAIAVQAIKQGAEDYLLKSQLTPERLQVTLQAAIQNASLKKQLQQSETLFRTSFETLLDCFGICSAIRDNSGQILDFRIDYLNAAALESNQLTPEHFGQGLCELFPYHRDIGLFDGYCHLVETGEPLVIENLGFTGVFGDEPMTRFYDLNASKLNDGFVVSWREVTQRQQSQRERENLLELEQEARLAAERNLKQYRLALEQLRNSERRFRAIFNSTYQFTGLLTPAGILLEANQSALDFGGLWRGEVINRPLWETPWWRISLEAQTQLQTAIAQAAAGEFVRYEVELLGAAGRRATIDFSLKPVQDVDENVVMLILEGRDISERKQTEAALRESEQRFRQLAENIDLVFWVLKLPEQQLVYVSPAYERLWGLDRQQLYDNRQTWLDRIHPQDRDRVEVAFRAKAAVGQFDEEYRIMLADGNVRWVRDRCFPLRNESGSIDYLTGIAEDITLRRQVPISLMPIRDEGREPPLASACP